MKFGTKIRTTRSIDRGYGLHPIPEGTIGHYCYLIAGEVAVRLNLYGNLSLPPDSIQEVPEHPLRGLSWGHRGTRHDTNE